MKALVIGKSAYNYSTLVDAIPLEGSDTTFSDVTESGSGSAANVAYMLGKYGVETYISTSVGDDTYGNLIRKEFESVGIHVEHIDTAYEKRTPVSLTLINKQTKVKTVNNIVKEPLLAKKIDYTMDPDIIYVDGFDYGASLAALNKYANKTTILGAKECNKDILELCKYCTYIIATKEFAEWVSGMKIDYTNSQSLVAVYSALLNKFVRKTLIITLGNQGALYISANQIKVMPGLNMEALDTTGSGDFFRGAFVYALSQNYDIERAVTFANIAGGLSSTKMGTRSAVPDLSDIMTYFEQKYPNTVQTAPTQQVQATPDSPAQATAPTQPAAAPAQPTTQAPAQPVAQATTPQAQAQPAAPVENASNQ